MKFKNMPAFMLALLMLFAVPGCGGAGGTTSSEAGVSSAVSSEPASSEVSSSPASSEITREMTDGVAREFLELLKDKNIKEIAKKIGSDEERLGILNTVDINSYSFEFDKEENGYYFYDVTLDVEKSGLEEFSAGVNEYVLSFDEYIFESDPFYQSRSVKEFRLKNRKEPVFSQNDYTNDLYLISYFFTHFNSDGFITSDNFKSYDEDVHIFMCLIVMQKVVGGEAFTAEQINEFSEKTYGISGLDVEKHSKDNYRWEKVSDNKYATVPRGISGYVNLGREIKTDEGSNQFYVVIDYYADANCIIKAKTMKYHFSKNEDGSFGLVKTELIYDSGVEPITDAE